MARRSQSEISPKTLAALQRKLTEAEARSASLTARLERQRALIREYTRPMSAAASFIRAHPTLTKREREVLLAFLEYLNDHDVAAHLGTKLQTVKNQVQSIMFKLGVKSREEMVWAAFFGGLQRRANALVKRVRAVKRTSARKKKRRYSERVTSK